MSQFVETWKSRTCISKIIFLLIILYCISSINVLLLAFGLTKWIPNFHLNARVLITFSVTSFALTLLVSAYHLSTFLRRRKRASDRVADAQAKASAQRQG
jgi:membrane protein implicated in regulation of membrane protease activity